MDYDSTVMIHEPHITSVASRQVMYRFLSIGLADPRVGAAGELWAAESRQLVCQAAAIFRDQFDAPPQTLARGELPRSELDPGLVFAALPATPETLNAVYESTFGLLVSSACPPYETEFIHSKLDFQRAQALSDIAGFYSAFGFDVSRDHPERPDHLAVELEFMASLLGLERFALQESSIDASERVDICHRAQRTFLQEHLAWWVPTFAKLLTQQAVGTFYAATARVLAAWIAIERDHLDVPVIESVARPMSIERPEECQGCLLQL